MLVFFLSFYAPAITLVIREIRPRFGNLGIKNE
jgi:hypothetical protein